MKNFYFSLLLLCAFSFAATAQTWNGSTSSDWNTAANWTPATVPTATSTVSIPSFAITNFPQLSSNITIERMTMTSGAKLDVNGFVVTILGGNGSNIFFTDTINNSAPGTNIVFNIASNTGYSSRFSGCVFTDTVTFNVTGLGAFYEGYSGSVLNRFNHEVNYNVNTTANFYTAYISETVHLESVTVNRTVPGLSGVLQDGGSIAGDFSFTNLVGGQTSIGSSLLSELALITGKVDIQVADTSNSPFLLRNVKNTTTGGIIAVQGSRGFTVENDTLLVNSISLTNYKGASYGYFYYNDITGDVTLRPDSSYAGSYFTALRGNVITGTSTFTNPCSNAFYEAFAANGGSIYNGNTIVNATGIGTVELGYQDASTFNGDLTVDRTVAGNTVIFKNGGTLNGHFTYNNNTSGYSYIGNLTLSKPTLISGAININMPLSAPGRFRLYNVKNQTGTGVISTNNTLGADIRLDTLLLNTMTIAHYTGNDYARFYDNHITGAVNLSSDSTYIGGYTTDLRRNTINGNTALTINSSNTLNEANSSNAGNTFNGNLLVTANGSGTTNLGYQDTSSYNGDVTIVRNAIGTTTAFGSGGVITGDLSYTNNAGGITNFGYPGYPTIINGMVDMDADYTTPATFTVRDITNQTTGGVIDIKGTQGFNFRNDTLTVASMSMTEYTGNAYARMYNCDITGDLTISSDSTYAGGYYTDLRDNVVTGNTVATLKGVNAFYEDYGGGTVGNVFNGNTIFNASGTGTLRISSWYGSEYNGDLTVNRTVDGITHIFREGGDVSGNYSFNKTASGAVYMGSSSFPTDIMGTINISANDTLPQFFRLLRLSNQTTGGIIDIQNSRGATIDEDTLKVTSFTLAKYRGAEFARIYDNLIEGDVIITSDSASSAGYFTELERNTFVGNTTITNNGTNIFYGGDGFSNGNQYDGNLTINEGQGSIRLALGDTSTISGDLILNSTSTIQLGDFLFTGNTNTIIDQLGTQAVEMDKIIMDKTGASLTLNTPVLIDEDVAFINGNIVSTTTNKLTVLDNATTSGASNASHVEGVVSKIGNEAFTFPIGKNNKYAPLGISQPSNTSDEFTAEYFESTPHTSGYDSSMKDASIDHISRNEYWICDRTAGTSNVDVTLSWDMAQRSGIVNNLGDLLVCRWDGTSWKNEGQASNTGTFSNGTVTSNSVTNFSPFTLGSSTSNNPLPLSLMSFDASKENNTAHLQWITENEIGVLEFEVQRSSDALHFEMIDKVQAVGTNMGRTNYKSYDVQPISGFNYYRLKMIDQDGKFAYSETRMLNFSEETQTSLYPNPVKDVLQIQSEDKISALEIYDVSGSMITKLAGPNIENYDMRSFTKGIYIIKLYREGAVETFRILKD